MNRKTVATLKIKTSKDGKYCFDDYNREICCPFLEDAYKGNCSIFGKLRLAMKVMGNYRHKNCIAGEVA